MWGSVMEAAVSSEWERKKWLPSLLNRNVQSCCFLGCPRVEQLEMLPIHKGCTPVFLRSLRNNTPNKVRLPPLKDGGSIDVLLCKLFEFLVRSTGGGRRHVKVWM